MSLAARLNKRITIQLQGTEQDATGQVIDEWKNEIGRAHV